MGRTVGFLLLAWLAVGGAALAQDMEPRRWTHLPAGTDVLGTGYVYTTGDLILDPVLQIEGADVVMHTFVASYNHYFGLCDKTARIDVRLPVQDGLWEGMRAGAPVSADRYGLGDPRIRFSINLAGAPALSDAEFLEYRKEHTTNTTVGAGVAVELPWGEYFEEKLINLGENRFTIEPQCGVLHTHGPWSFELTGSAFFYTENDAFFGGSRLEQDPLYLLQAHVVRTFKGGLWASAGAAYDWAGRSTIDGARKEDEKNHLLYGASIGFPLGRAQGVRVGYIRGRTFADVGTNSHSVFVSWSLRF